MKLSEKVEQLLDAIAEVETLENRLEAHREVCRQLEEEIAQEVRNSSIALRVGGQLYAIEAQRATVTLVRLKEIE